MREKTRYIALQLVSAQKSDETQAKHLIYEALFQTLGEHGASKAAVQLKAFDAPKQRVLIKCANSEAESVIAALALKRTFRGVDVALRVLRVSGSVAGAGDFPRRPAKK